MSNRTVRAAQKRAQRRIQQKANFARLTDKSGSEGRAEALSTIKRTTTLRG